MRKTYNQFILLILGLTTSLSIQAQYNYAEVLQKSMFFYECQESGELNSGNRVNWRGNSATDDGSDVGIDLTGGWYDAGDHVKFNFPMAFSATALAWGGIDFKEGYEQSGQIEYLKRNLRWVNDYFIKCHTSANELYGQVGNGGTDHSWWGSSEVMRMDRPSYKIDASSPGSDLAGETAAAMAAASILFQDDDPTYSATLISHAKELYEFADNYRDAYSNSITDAAGYYNSYSGYKDELVWGAIWLYRATGEEAYLEKAEEYYDDLNTENQSSDRSYTWGLAWDDKSYGCYALLAKLTGKEKYITDIERHLDYWTDGYNGNKITYTSGGLAYLDKWGALRYSANTSFLAAYYADIASTTTKQTTYSEFATSQMEYILGDNPLGSSYVCGYGTNPPVNPHHRTAHGCWSNNQNGPPTETRHILYGALVGGPDSDDTYSDDRSNYINNEVACDYNACFSGLLAYFVEEEGGSPLSDFPVEETPTDEYIIEAKINSSGSNFTEWSTWVHNHTAWPSRAEGEYKYQLFIDISEGVDAGYTASDYTVKTNNSSTVDFTDLQAWDESNYIYYTEVTIKSDIDIWPGGTSESKEESQVRISLPDTAPSGAWDASNDWSSQELGSTLVEYENIPMYVDNSLVFGATPTEAIPVESVSLSTTAETLDIDDEVTITATVLPEDASNKTVTWSSSDESIATVTSEGVVTAIAAGDAVITATTSVSTIYATCDITVNEPPYIEVTDVVLSSTALSLDINETATLTATVSPDDATDPSVTWSSSDESIATVSSTGVVTGITEGDVVITVNTSNSDVSADCQVSVSDVVITPTYYELNISITGSGTVTTEPEGTSFEEGTEVTLTAEAESGYVFEGWSGDESGTSETLSITMDSNKTITATFAESSGTCDDPTTISLPFEHDGAGEFCYSTSDDIAFFNSWNMEKVEVNGVDYTNEYVADMPDKIDGKYYIKLVCNYAWSHFEAELSSKSAITKTNSESVKKATLVYPNPFKASTTLEISDVDKVENVTIIDQLGRVIKQIPGSSIESNKKIGNDLEKGIYFIVIQTKNQKEVIKIIKE